MANLLEETRNLMPGRARSHWNLTEASEDGDFDYEFRQTRDMIERLNKAQPRFHAELKRLSGYDGWVSYGTGMTHGRVFVPFGTFARIGFILNHVDKKTGVIRLYRVDVEVSPRHQGPNDVREVYMVVHGTIRSQKDMHNRERDVEFKRVFSFDLGRGKKSDRYDDPKVVLAKVGPVFNEANRTMPKGMRAAIDEMSAADWNLTESSEKKGEPLDAALASIKPGTKLRVMRLAIYASSLKHSTEKEVTKVVAKVTPFTDYQGDEDILVVFKGKGVYRPFQISGNYVKGYILTSGRKPPMRYQLLSIDGRDPQKIAAEGLRERAQAESIAGAKKHMSYPTDYPSGYHQAVVGLERKRMAAPLHKAAEAMKASDMTIARYLHGLAIATERGDKDTQREFLGKLPHSVKMKYIPSALLTSLGEDVAGAPGAFAVSDAPAPTPQDQVADLLDRVRNPRWEYPSWALPKVKLDERDESVFDKPQWVADFKAGWRAAKEAKTKPGAVAPRTAYDKGGRRLSQKHGLFWIDGYSAYIDLARGAYATKQAHIAKKMGLAEATASGGSFLKMRLDESVTLSAFAKKIAKEGQWVKVGGGDIQFRWNGMTYGEVHDRRYDGSQSRDRYEVEDLDDELFEKLADAKKAVIAQVAAPTIKKDWPGGYE